MSHPGIGHSGQASYPPLHRIVRVLPRSVFERPAAKSFGYLVRDLLQIAVLGAAIIWVNDWLLALPLALLLGCSLTGIFVLAHDCGHRSFSQSIKVNDLVGELMMPLTLWPYQAWRLSHDHHHRHTHNAKRDIAWKPLTPDQYMRLSPLVRGIYKWSRTWLSGFASVLFQYFMVQDALTGKFFASEDRAKLQRSLLICAVIVALYVAVAASFGWYGLVMLFVLPQLMFQFWLSFFTLLHHTRPEEPPFDEEHWDAGRAQLGASIHMTFPRAVEWLTHDISWHVPHHVCVGVPHYHLREAHAALRQAFPDLVIERSVSWAYWRAIISQCHLVEAGAGGLHWLTFGELAQRQARLTSANRTLA